jgi:hypothetical protein
MKLHAIAEWCDRCAKFLAWDMLRNNVSASNNTAAYVVFAVIESWESVAAREQPLIKLSVSPLTSDAEPADWVLFRRESLCSALLFLVCVEPFKGPLSEWNLIPNQLHCSDGDGGGAKSIKTTLPGAISGKLKPASTALMGLIIWSKRR